MAHLAERLLATNVGVRDLSATPEASADMLTVVIPVQDRPAQLDRALTPLRPLGCLAVDDASQRPTAVAEVAGRYRAEVVALSTNVGPAGARNAGLARVANALRGVRGL